MNTSALSGTALNPHVPAEELGWGDTQTVNELGLIDPVQGYGVRVAVTMLVPDTCTTCGWDRVYSQDGSPVSAGVSALTGAGKHRPVNAIARQLTTTPGHRLMAGSYRRFRGVRPQPE